MNRLSKSGVATAIGIPLLLIAGFWGWLHWKVSQPRGADVLASYGVKYEWKVGGATNSYPWIEVWYEDETQGIDCPRIFGGMVNPELSFKDIDDDGIPEIHFLEGEFGQIVGFKPATETKFPRWIVHKNRPQSGSKSILWSRKKNDEARQISTT